MYGKIRHYRSSKRAVLRFILNTPSDKKVMFMTMFSKTLAQKLLQLADEKRISQETLAEICDVSPRYMGNIVRGHQVPTIATLEKICKGLEMTPDKLLLTERESGEYVTQYMQHTPISSENIYPLCPSCRRELEREYQNYCDRCGQRLLWDESIPSEVLDFSVSTAIKK